MRSLSDAGRRRLLLALLAVLVVAAGLLTKRYQGPGQGWVRGSAGAVLYEVLWIALAQLVWIRARTWVLALIVLLATCGVELLQLCEQAWLVALRETFGGRMILGTNGGFDPLDFLHYLIGSGVGYALCVRLGLGARRETGARTRGAKT